MRAVTAMLSLRTPSTPFFALIDVPSERLTTTLLFSLVRTVSVSPVREVMRPWILTFWPLGTCPTAPRLVVKTMQANARVLNKKLIAYFLIALSPFLLDCYLGES